MASREIHPRFAAIPTLLMVFLAANGQAQTASSVRNEKLGLQANSPLPDAPSARLQNGFSGSAASAGFEDARVNLQLPKFSITVFAPESSWQGPGAKPLSREEKFRRFVRNSYSSSALATTALSAHLPLSFGDEQQRNFAQRYATAYADAQANAFFQSFLIPALAHQDPRYLPAVTGKFSNRLVYASTRILIGRTDKGTNTFNSAAVAGAFVAAAVSNAYHPYYNRGVEGTLNRALGHLVTEAGMNVLREFWPDLRRKFKGRMGALMDCYAP